MGPLDVLGRVFGVDDRRWTLTVPVALQKASDTLASSRTLSDETTVQQLDTDRFLVHNREWTDTGRLATFDRFQIQLSEASATQTRVDVLQRVAPANAVFLGLLLAGLYAFGGWGIATAAQGTWQALVVVALPVGYWLLIAVGRESAHTDCSHFLWSYLSETDAPAAPAAVAAQPADPAVTTTRPVGCNGLDSHRIETPRRSRLIAVAIAAASLTIIALAPLPIQAATLLGGIALGYAALAILSLRRIVITADHLTCTFLRSTWHMALRDVTRVGIKTIGANTFVMLYPKTGQTRNLPFGPKLRRREPLISAHLLHWLDRPDVIWEPASRETITGSTTVAVSTTTPAITAADKT